MKAAAEAWGGNIEDFKRGFARQTDDPELVAATMAKPGVVLKRPVGSSVAYTEHAKLPKDLVEKTKESPANQPPKKKPRPARKLDAKATRAAALAFEREQKRRETARQKEEAAREQKRRRREQLRKCRTSACTSHAAPSSEVQRDRAPTCCTGKTLSGGRDPLGERERQTKIRRP